MTGGQFACQTARPATPGASRVIVRSRWFGPSDHGVLPDIVANGCNPGASACGYRHGATGPGGPENADLAGLPKSYIIQQMADYKSGARGTAVPELIPPKLMIEPSKPITDAEIEAAAAYFSALRLRKRIRWSRATPRKDLCGGSALGCGGKRRARADRSANRGGPGRSAPLRKPLPSIDLHGQCTNREHGQRRGASHEGGSGKRSNARRAMART